MPWVIPGAGPAVSMGSEGKGERGRVVKPPQKRGAQGDEWPEDSGSGWQGGGRQGGRHGGQEGGWQDSWQQGGWHSGGGGQANSWQAGPVEQGCWPQMGDGAQGDSWQTGEDQGSLASGGQSEQEAVAAVEELLATNGGMLPFTEVTRYFPSIALKDLRAAFKVTFDGAWQVHANRGVVQARPAGLVTAEAPAQSQSAWEQDSWQQQKAPAQPQSAWEQDSWQQQKAPAQSPSAWEQDSWQQQKASARSSPVMEEPEEAPSAEPLEDAVFNRVIALLLEAGGTMPLWRLCCAVPGVKKAQLMNYFDLTKLPNGQYEVRMSGAAGESALNSQGDGFGAKDQAAAQGQAASLTEEQLRDVAAYIAAQGGKSTDDDLFAQFPGMTREHLAENFELQRWSGRSQGWNQNREVYEVSLKSGMEYPGVQGSWAQQSYGASKGWTKPDAGMDPSSGADQDWSQQSSGADNGWSRQNSSANKGWRQQSSETSKGWAQQSSSSNKGRSSRRSFSNEQEMAPQQSDMSDAWPPEGSSGNDDWSGMDNAWPSQGPCKGGGKGGKAAWKGDMEGGKGCMMPGKGYMDGCKGSMAGGKGFDGGKGYMDGGKGCMDGGKGCMDGGKGFDGGKGYMDGGKGFMDGGKGYMDGGKGCMDGGKGFMDGGKGFMDGGKGFMDGGKGFMDGGKGGKFGKGGKACKGGSDAKWQPSLGPSALGPVFPISWDPTWADFWGPPVALVNGWDKDWMAPQMMAPGKGCWAGDPPDWGCKGQGWGCKGPCWGCKGQDWGGKGPDWAGKGQDWGPMQQKGWGPWAAKGCNGYQEGPQAKKPRRTAADGGQQATSWASMAEGAGAPADSEEAAEWEQLLQNWEVGDPEAPEAEEAAAA